MTRASDTAAILRLVLSEETALDLDEYRTKRAKLDKKSVWSAGAAKGLVRELSKHQDPDAAALEMMARGWLTNKVKWPVQAGAAQSYRQNAREANATMTLMLLEGEGDNGYAFDLLDYRH
jgi:hypothetical protein